MAATDFKDHYAILVSKTASVDEIKQVFANWHANTTLM